CARSGDYDAFDYW
nr:immunoglobulin heavy chain junction region [Mus musculus]